MEERRFRSPDVVGSIPACGSRLLRIKRLYPNAVLYFVGNGDWSGCPPEWKAFVNYGLLLYGKDPGESDTKYTRFHNTRMRTAGFVPKEISGRNHFYFASPEARTAFFLACQGDDNIA